MRSCRREAKRNNGVASKPSCHGHTDHPGKFLASIGIVFGVVFTSVFPVLVAQTALSMGQVLASYVGLLWWAVRMLLLAFLHRPSQRNRWSLCSLESSGAAMLRTSFALGFVSPELAELFSYVSFKEHFRTMERGVQTAEPFLLCISRLYRARFGPSFGTRTLEL